METHLAGQGQHRGVGLGVPESRWSWVATPRRRHWAETRSARVLQRMEGALQGRHGGPALRMCKNPQALRHGTDLGAPAGRQSRAEGKGTGPSNSAGWGPRRGVQGLARVGVSSVWIRLEPGGLSMCLSPLQSTHRVMLDLLPIPARVGTRECPEST